MVETAFARKAAQFHALAGELAAVVSSDTSGILATELLPEIFGAGRHIDLLTCRLIERADRSGTYKSDGAANLEMLCSHHHHAVHEGGWQITIGNDPQRT